MFESIVRHGAPILDKNVVNHLYRVDNKIYNKFVLDNQMPLFKCKDDVFKDNIIYAYNYENTAYIYTASSSDVVLFRPSFILV